jgi:hypothetical protein
MPPVRRTVNTAQASRIATTNAARRSPAESRRVATAQATSARHWTGMEETGSIIPIIPFAIDGCTMRLVMMIAMTINTIAPKRSTQGARLKNSHQTRIASAHTIAPSIAPMAASGATTGTTNQSSHCSTTATTPGHSRSGFRGVGFCGIGWSFRAMVSSIWEIMGGCTLATRC